MEQFNHRKPNIAREKLGLAVDWILDHTKIVMPLILIICVLITVFIALNANQRAQLEKEAEIAAANAVEVEEVVNLVGITIPDIPLEENAYPEINDLVTNYYAALAEGDIESVAAVNPDLDDIARIRVQEMSNYIDHYEMAGVFTKVGLTEGSYVTYVYTEVKFNDVEALVPGFRIYYISKDEDGNMCLKDDNFETNIYEYIKTVSLQDDVVDLNNKVTVEYNDLIAEDKELEEFISYMSGKIDENVGVILAQAEQPDITAETMNPQEAAGSASEGAASETTANEVTLSKIMQAKVTDVVNIRSSDSETADKLDKAQVGQEFTILEQKGNGWSRVKYKDGEGYIKSDYLEIISEETIETPAEETAASSEPAQSASSVNTSGTVKVKETVRVRSKASTEGDILGTVYAGEKLDLVEQQSGGWTKVTYKGKVGYVKSDYVE